MKLNPGTFALLLVQIALGYEWLVSGLTKLLSGGFPQGLAAELRDMSGGALVGGRLRSRSRTRAGRR